MSSSPPPPPPMNPPSTSPPQQTQSSSPPPSSSTTSIPTTISQEQHTGAPSSSTTNPITTLTSQEQKQELQQPSQPEEIQEISSPQRDSSQPQTDVSASTPPPSSTTLTPQQTSHTPPPAASSSPSREQNLQQLQPQNWRQTTKPYAIVILLQLLFAIMNFLTKLAMNNGMDSFVFVAYRNIPACLLISPFAAYMERYKISILLFNLFWLVVFSILLYFPDIPRFIRKVVVDWPAFLVGSFVVIPLSIM